MVLALTASHQYGHRSQNWQALHAEVAQLEVNLLLFLQQLRSLSVNLPGQTMHFSRGKLPRLGDMDVFALSQSYDNVMASNSIYAVSSARLETAARAAAPCRMCMRVGTCMSV